MKNLPKKIYLNLGDGCFDDADFRDISEVTWSEEKVNDTDVEYVRKSQWISVDERLPEDDETVLTYSSYGYVLAYYSEQDRMWFAYGNYGDINPTHWLPIPPLNPEKEEV